MSPPNRKTARKPGAARPDAPAKAPSSRGRRGGPQLRGLGYKAQCAALQPGARSYADQRSVLRAGPRVPGQQTDVCAPGVSPAKQVDPACKAGDPTLSQDVFAIQMSDYATGILDSLSKREADATTDWFALLTTRMEEATDVVNMVAGSTAAAVGAVGATGAIGSTPHGGLGLALFTLVAAGGSYVVGRDIKKDCKAFITRTEAKCMANVRAHRKRYVPIVQKVVADFVSAKLTGGGSLCVSDLTALRAELRKKLEPPTLESVYNLRWNTLSRRWKKYLDGSKQMAAYKASLSGLYIAEKKAAKKPTRGVPMTMPPSGAALT